MIPTKRSSYSSNHSNSDNSIQEHSHEIGKITVPSWTMTMINVSAKAIIPMHKQRLKSLNLLHNIPLMSFMYDAYVHCKWIGLTIKIHTPTVWPVVLCTIKSLLISWSPAPVLDWPYFHILKHQQTADHSLYISAGFLKLENLVKNWAIIANGRGTHAMPFPFPF